MILWHRRRIKTKAQPAAEEMTAGEKPTDALTETERDDLRQLLASNASFMQKTPSYRGDEDGFVTDIEDKTGINWLIPRGESLERSVRDYVSIKVRTKSVDNRDLRGNLPGSWYWYFRNENTIFLIDSSEQLPKEREASAQLKTLAEEHKIGIAEPKDEGIYYEHIHDRYLLVRIVETWPGSADDAATYGVLRAEEITKEKAENMIRGQSRSPKKT